MLQRLEISLVRFDFIQLTSLYLQGISRLLCSWKNEMQLFSFHLEGIGTLSGLAPKENMRRLNHNHSPPNGSFPRNICSEA